MLELWISIEEVDGYDKTSQRRTGMRRCGGADAIQAQRGGLVRRTARQTRDTIFRRQGAVITGARNPPYLLAFAVEVYMFFCPLHAYCPLCHVWQPSDAIWVDEDCCAYGKCRMGSLCRLCEGVLETKNERTQQAARILQQKFGRPLWIVAKEGEGKAEVPLEPVRGVLPGAFGKEPERVVRSWMVMPYPELCPWPVEKPKQKSGHLHRQPSGGEDQDRGRAVADNLHVGGGDRDEGCAVAEPFPYNSHGCLPEG